MTNMKNKSRTIVVTSSAGFPSKTGALEMLVSFGIKRLYSGVERSGTVGGGGGGGEVGNVRELKVAEEGERIVIPKVLEAMRNSQPFFTEYCTMFCISKRIKRQEPLLMEVL